METMARQGKYAHGVKYKGAGRQGKGRGQEKGKGLTGRTTKRETSSGLSLRQKAKTKRWQARMQAKVAARKRASRGGSIK